MKRFFSYLVVAAMIFLVALSVSSCEKDKETPTYTVTFNSKGGTPTPQQQTVKEGGKVAKPTDPTLENYGFAGWAKADNETSVLWNFETETVVGDVTLFARWVINTYLVTFNSDGGTAVENKTVSHGSPVAKPTDPTRDGYEFDGWFNGETEWNFNTAITAAITLKAKWTKVHTVTFDSDGGSEVAAQTIRDGNTAVKPVDPTKAWAPASGLYLGTPPSNGNYTFDGWYNGDTEWDFGVAITAPVTLKAKWTADFSLTRIESVLSNDVAAAVTYVNANSNGGEEYTLLIGASNVTVGAQTLNVANAKLTIVGIGTERTIMSTATSLFTINGNNVTSLTIGQNITLKRSTNGGGNPSNKLVCVLRGNLVMRDGAKIISDGNAVGAVFVSGLNSVLKMEGGEIISPSFSMLYAEYSGVYVSDNGTFEMSGGSTAGNSASAEVIYVDYNGTFRLSGNAKISTLMLNADNNTTRPCVTIDGNFSGTVTRLHLRGNNSNENTIATWWTNAPVIVNGTVNVINMFNNGLGNFYSSSGLSTGTSISATHVLNADGFLVLKEN